MATRRSRCPVAMGLAVALALAACEHLVPGEPAVPDSVRVVVTGLPSDVPARVIVVDPDGIETLVESTATLTDLAPGTYRITATTVDFRGNEFHAVPVSLSVPLAPEGSEVAVIRYAPDRPLGRTAAQRLNVLRTGAGLQPVTLDEEGSLPQWLHTRYAAENRAWGHSEDPSLPWSTPEGLDAARRSNLAYGSVFADPRDPSDGAMWIDVWAQAPFHLFSMMDPRTKGIRFASYRAEHPCGDGAPEACSLTVAVAALQALRDGPWPSLATVEFPGPGSTIDLAVFRGEWPSPLASCPGYTSPAGLPLFAMVGPQGPSPPRIVTSTVERDGHPVDHCAIDAANYVNPDEEAQRLARSILAGHGAVVLVPREPLVAGSSYRVVLTTDLSSHDWTFGTASVMVHDHGTGGAPNRVAHGPSADPRGPDY